MVQAASSEVTEAQREPGAATQDCGSIPTGRSGGGRGDVVRCAIYGTLPRVEPLSLFLNIVDWRSEGRNRQRHKNYSEICACRSLCTLHVVNRDCFKWPGNLGNRIPDACVTMGGASFVAGSQRKILRNRRGPQWCKRLRQKSLRHNESRAPPRKIVDRYQRAGLGADVEMWCAVQSMAPCRASSRLACF